MVEGIGNEGEKRSEPIIAGIGASAGGLEALQTFVRKIPEKSGIAFVIAQHLSPTYKSMMVDLLAKETNRPVIGAQKGLVVRPDTIYICPPNKNITINNGVIHLSDPGASTYNPKPSIDILFESIAAYKGSRAVGIILSGTGSDGSRGIRAIKAEGGFTFVQEPTTAKYDGMPNSAINTGNVDLILPPEEIPEELIDILSYPDRTKVTPDSKEITDIYSNILRQLVKAKGIDFELYKSSTILRRIERRMATLKITGISDYNNHLRKSAGEVDLLFKDILIGVTAFFRDDVAFEALKERMHEKIRQKEEKLLRVWIPGCSTGEEAYTIAMILSDILQAEVGMWKVQIFATDIDEEALDFARKGLYPESALVSLERKVRNKFFTLKNELFEVIKPIREMVIFSRHDVIKDPPFLKLDLISCRNLLIYFTTELQRRLFPTFHYALRDYGTLFLGKSESIGQFHNYFNTTDKKWKIYEAVYLGHKQPPIASEFNLRDYKDPNLKTYGTKAVTPQEMMTEQIQSHVMPMCIMVNEIMDIIYLSGKNPYVSRPVGDVTDNVYKSVHPALSVELRAAVHISVKEERVVRTHYQKVLLFEELTRFVRMTVVPITGG